MKPNITSLLKWLALPLLFSATAMADETQWLTYKGGDGPGKGKHIVLITADQEYRSEQSLPMMAKILSERHGFDCTVLFGVNEEGLVDPTMPVHPEKGKEAEFKPHSIPGLEKLESADAMIFVTRLLTLPDDQLQHIVRQHVLLSQWCARGALRQGQLCCCGSALGAGHAAKAA